MLIVLFNKVAKIIYFITNCSLKIQNATGSRSKYLSLWMEYII